MVHGKVVKLCLIAGILCTLTLGLSFPVFAGGPMTMEANTNRPGQDYRNFELDTPDPSLCQKACADDPNCQAYTYVKPGIQGPKARCWLKKGVPAAQSNNCCVSGVKTAQADKPKTPQGGGSWGISPSVSLETDTNRPGKDYKNFELDTPDPGLCQKACANDPNCQAYTYVKPGIQGAKARCWLKKTVPPAQSNNCCVSGVKTAQADKPKTPQGGGSWGISPSVSLETDTNRPGKDYKNFELDTPDPGLCQKACTDDPNCNAYTYVKPGIQGAKARCWLKKTVPPAQTNNCCVSGVKGALPNPMPKPVDLKSLPGDPMPKPEGSKEGFCRQYAEGALRQISERIERTGPAPANDPVWKKDFNHHYNWCLQAPESLVNDGSKLREDWLDRHLQRGALPNPMPKPEDVQSLPGDIAQQKTYLYASSNHIWSGPIPVCWETSGFTNEKIHARVAIANTWESESAVQFTGWGDCSHDSTGIRIAISDSKKPPHTKKLGKLLDGYPSGMVLNFTFSNWGTYCASPAANRTSCIRSIAVHEFGHALGFAHEQNRPDSICEIAPQGSDGDTIVGVWDLSSVMNYCNPSWNNNGVLSAGDIEGVRMFYGAPPTLMASPPNGSYIKTCNNVSADGQRLYANCRDKSGVWWRTSLSNYSGCTSDIANLDGYLGCTGVFPPKGSYERTCRDIVISDSLMHATCKSKSGRWQKTSLADFKSCTSDISNSDGNLSCLKNSPPNGSYQQTCRDIIADGNALYATCRETSGSWNRSSIADFTLCSGDIWNSDGLLRCSNGMVPPNGSYRTTCVDIFVNSTTLSAVCKTKSGKMKKTTLANFKSCRSDIGNSDGSLTCK